MCYFPETFVAWLPSLPSLFLMSTSHFSDQFIFSMPLALLCLMLASYRRLNVGLLLNFLMQKALLAGLVTQTSYLFAETRDFGRVSTGFLAAWFSGDAEPSSFSDRKSAIG